MDIKGIRMDDDAEDPSAIVAGQRGSRSDGIDEDKICGRGPWGPLRENRGYQRLLETKPGEHDRLIANILCIASTWAYSDIDTFARVMHCRGSMRGSETVGITNINPVLFEHTTAYLTQSKDRRVAILCFCGAEIKNAIDSLLQLDSQEPLMSMGRVHGGLYRSILSLWPLIEFLLMHACKGKSICDAAMRAKSRAHSCVEEATRYGRPPQQLPEQALDADSLSRILPSPMDKGGDKLEALYITGHGIGGALAVLAAALIEMTPTLHSIRRKLQGIYTYGQTNVGDRDFARTFEPRFGSKIFRHVDLDDFVTYLPINLPTKIWSPIELLKFYRPKNFIGRLYWPLGQTLIPSEAGWAPLTTLLPMSFKLILKFMTIYINNTAAGGIIGVYLAPQASSTIPFWGFTIQAILPRVQFPRQLLQKNYPINYLRVSQRMAPGSELL
ncbi:lipase family protein [Sorangium sp. So ce693]|uniref:lipase family protein n=1 Tax=Sorangium sp. So ce693 TaxID=3133318 RepID=UPI003F63BE7D